MSYYSLIDPHVSESNRTVLRKIYKRFGYSAKHTHTIEYRQARKAVYKSILESHNKAQELVREWRL